MVEAGCLKNPDVDAIITPHIWHEVPKGKIGMKAGTVMASGDLFTLKVHGKAGHGHGPTCALILSLWPPSLFSHCRRL